MCNLGGTRGIESTIRGSWSKQVLQKITSYWLILFFTAALQLCMTGIQIIKTYSLHCIIWVIVRNIRNYQLLMQTGISWNSFSYSIISWIFWGEMCVCVYDLHYKAGHSSVYNDTLRIKFKICFAKIILKFSLVLTSLQLFCIQNYKKHF